MTHPRAVPALASGCALVAIVNAVILGAAAWNKSGAGRTEMTLTERELALPAYREPESSSLRLTLKFASDPLPAVSRVLRRKGLEPPAVDEPWLDRDKLDALGFRLNGESIPSDRTALIVLELDGDSWIRWLTDREARLRDSLPQADAEAVLALDRAMRSRLVPIDAGRDAAALRSRYPDRARHLIVPGLVRAVRKGSVSGGAAWRGQIALLAVSDLRVPRELAPALTNVLPLETERAAFERERREPQISWPSPSAPRYRAVVAFGRANEPWLVSVDAPRSD